MTKLVEGDLEFDFDAAVSARVFDDTTHGLSHCMKAVDFIVDDGARVVFVEVKDPGNPRATKKAKEAFFANLKNGSLHRDLAIKYRDSYLYERASKRIAGTPPAYVVIIALPTTTTAALGNETARLKSALPFEGPGGAPWPAPFASGCVVVDLKGWGLSFPAFPITRVSSKTRPKPT